MRYALFSGTVFTVTAAPAQFLGMDINAILTFLFAAGGGAAAWKIVGLILDKVVPSRSDKRSDVETSLGALAKTIEILSTEKASDSARIAQYNLRIQELEKKATVDYELINVLRDAKDDLERRILSKDVHITQLTMKLAEYGAKVTFDGDGHLRIDPHKTGPVTIVA